jgi:hypothetical protein
MKPTASSEPKTIQDVTLDDVILATTSDEPKIDKISRELAEEFCKDSTISISRKVAEEFMEWFPEGSKAVLPASLIVEELRRAIGKGEEKCSP